MELDTLTRIGLIIAGLLLILFVNVDFTYVLSKLIFWNKKGSTETDFLKMVNLWYQLKNMCENNKFDKASKKLDEVFPLLNNGDENE
jgi:hypothetical protein